MKKIILTVSAALLATGAFAQFTPGEIQWGVKAGLNLAKITNDGAKMRTGLVIGGFGEYTVNEFLGIQAELVYSMQGAKGDAGGTDITIKNDYINLPILAKFYVLEALSVDIGPQFGYGIVTKYKAGGVTAELDDVFGDWKDFDVSAAMGLSYRFDYRFDVSARYNLGLTKLVKSTDTKNGVLQFSVGYRF